MRSLFITPHDVLMPRGNRAFGDAGEHGLAMELPWPSVFAGALRSALLASDRDALAAFPKRRPPGVLGEVLGTPDSPGSFRLRWLSLATRDAQGRVEPVLPLPADRLAFEEGSGRQACCVLRPQPWPGGVTASGALPMTAMLRGASRGKPRPGSLAGYDALRAYLDDDVLPAVGAAPSLWTKELRLGIAMSESTRTAAEGALYTSEALRFARRGESLEPLGPPSTLDAGYLVGIEGDSGLLSASGTLRLGGDGRAAHYESVSFKVPSPPLERIERDRRFKLVLLTPALWTQGWLPPFIERDGNGLLLDLDGVRARLACAALPRHEVVSGWDLATRRPKPAQRVAPAGSVYWFDRAEGDLVKLAGWVATGLWREDADPMRRTEGFNNALLAAWPAVHP